MSPFHLDLARALAEEHMTGEVEAQITTSDEPFDDGAGGNVPGPSTTVTTWGRLEENGGSEGITEEQLRTLGRYTLKVPVATLVRDTSIVTIYGKRHRVVALPKVDGLATVQPIGILEV